MISRPSVRGPLAVEQRRYAVAEERRFVRVHHRVASRGEALPLGITLKRTRELMGVIEIGFGPGAEGRGGLGYWLALEYWHKGYGSEAVSVVCETGFRLLDLHRIEASVFDSNPRSMALLRRLGFKAEGHRREVRKHGGDWEGEFVLGLLSNEFRPWKFAQVKPTRG